MSAERHSSTRPGGHRQPARQSAPTMARSPGGIYKRGELGWLDHRTASPRRHGGEVSVRRYHQECSYLQCQVKDTVVFPVGAIPDDLRRIGYPSPGRLGNLREHSQILVYLVVE